MLVIFVTGFYLIAFGSRFIDGVLTAFLTAFLCWGVIALKNLQQGHHFETEKFYLALGDAANIVFFLIFALTIVEIVKEYHGFDGLTAFLKKVSRNSSDKRIYFNQLLWASSFTTFFMASIIDNVTAAIIMTVMLGKILKNRNDLYFLALFNVISANAGGTFSPIGEVTTTMLWAGNLISFFKTITTLFIPSTISLIIPLLLYSITQKNRTVELTTAADSEANNILPKHTRIITLTAISAMLIVVPTLKGVFGLPPSIGALAALSVLWLVSDAILNRTKAFNLGKITKQKRTEISLKHAFANLEWEGPLFFFGILVAVGALKDQAILLQFGKSFDASMHHLSFHQPLFAFLTGILSSVTDNVALVATVMATFPAEMAGYEMNSSFWMMISYCAGTGGSILVIGSAAGVAVAAKLSDKFDAQDVDLHTWFRKNITKWAIINYVSGFIAYLIQVQILKYFI